MSLVTRRLCLVGGLLGLLAASAAAQSAPEAEFKTRFLKLCDLACEQINNPQRQEPKPVPFYNESYAVRALCVAYDMTDTERYLETSKRWTDRMIEYQGKMAPKGGYYMNYGRKPGENQGNWYVADSSSIAMGVLATAVRCSGPEREKYLNSVQQFARLVARNYIGEAGGVQNGFWAQYSGEWWCSSGIFGSLAFLLAEESGDRQYREIGLGAVNWLNHLDWSKTKFEYWRTGEPTVIMYCLEAYSAGMEEVKPGTELHRETMSKIRWVLDWMPGNQASRGGAGKWDYESQWGSKCGGLPFHMYVLSRHVTEGEKLREAADGELRHVLDLVDKDTSGRLSQLACFAMMSCAERLSPGAIYRKSK